MAVPKDVERRRAERATRRAEQTRAKQEGAAASAPVSLEELAARVAKLEQWSGVVGDKLLRELNVMKRLLWLDVTELPFPERLTAHRMRIASQSDEDGIVVALLREVGTGPRRFVEIGCGSTGGNSGLLALELAFSGLMVDGDDARVEVAAATFRRARVDVVHAWVTAENIAELIKEQGHEGEIDVLSIDLDGNDVWIWEAALRAVDPRIVVIEFNTQMGPDRAVAVPYAPDFDRHERRLSYYGASLAAVVTIGRRLGYRLVATTPGGTNAFLLRDGVGTHVPEGNAREMWSLTDKTVKKRMDRRGRLGDPVEDFYAYVAREKLPLVDLDGHEHPRS